MSRKISWFQKLRFQIAGIQPSRGIFQTLTREATLPVVKRFKRLPGKLSEALKDATSEKGLFVPAFKTRLGEQPPLDLGDLIDYYAKDPQVMASVDYMGEQVAGAGFYTICASGFEDAKKLVDDFCAKVNMDNLVMSSSKEIVSTGNTFWERVLGTEKKLVNLKLLPLSSIKTIDRDKYGRLQQIIQQVGTERVTFLPGEIIHFCLNPLDGSAWGTGILHSLASTQVIDETTARPAMLDIKARLMDDIWKIVHRYAAPKRLWSFLGVSDEKLRDEYTPTIQNAAADVDFATNKEVKVDSLDINPAARFDGMIEKIDSQVVQGLQTPITRLLTTPGFTEASSTVADNSSQRKIMFLQRFLARIVEKEVFELILTQNQTDPLKAGVRIRWGMPDKPEVKMEHIVQLAQISATSDVEYLTRDEVRTMLSKYAGFELQQNPEESKAPAAAPVHEAIIREVWDENENNLRYRVRDPAGFQDGTLRTIWFSQNEGIRAVVGRLKDEDKTSIQSILFSKEKDWTLDKAQAWIKDHPDLQVSENEPV